MVDGVRVCALFVTMGLENQLPHEKWISDIRSDFYVVSNASCFMHCVSFIVLHFHSIRVCNCSSFIADYSLVK